MILYLLDSEMTGSAEEYPTLVAQTGPLNGQRFFIQDKSVIGRESTCDVIVPSRQVSRFHARLTIDDVGVYLEDLGSKNGTHVNGEVLQGSILLKDGDVIQIALAQQFVFLSSDATLPLEPITNAGIEAGSGSNRLRLEKRSRRVWAMNHELLPPLSLAQFQLLELLYERQGRVVTRSELIQVVWGEEDAIGVSEQALDALIRRLRDRLAAVDPSHNYIVTVRGHGLRLDNPPIK